jgi:hypothetical protein
MEVKLRKLWPLVGALCATAFSSAFANSNYSSGSNSSSYGSSMDSGSGSTQSGQGAYQRGTFREITPNAGPRVAHGADVFITADFIWWNASQEGISYAATGFVTDDGTDPFASASKGKYDYVGSDWAPGFKVGLGLKLSHDGWDLYSQYTWLHASDSSSLSRENGVAYTGSLLPFEDGPTVGGNKVKADWDLHFNVIDLELGRNFYLSQFLTMRPFIGFKATWQDQDLKVTTESNQFEIDGNGQQPSTPVTGPFVHKNATDVWGIGVRGGLNVSWYMSKNWSFYGDLAWTTMWTDYDTLTRSDTLYDSTTGNSKTYFNVSNDDLYAVKYIGEMELGLRWEMWFYDDNYHFAIQAGWEQQVWVNWGQFVEILDHINHDLSLHGLNLKFRFDF